jgi:hypothetical protein
MSPAERYVGRVAFASVIRTFVVETRCCMRALVIVEARQTTPHPRIG